MSSPRVEPSLERRAVADLGSSAARIVVYDVSAEGHCLAADEMRERIRLADLTDANGHLSPEALQRTASIFSSFRAFAEASGATRIDAVATSAVRDALNADALVAAVREASDIELRVITGDEEARLDAIGVSNGFDVERAVVLDVGGGSAQVSRIEAGAFAGGVSFPAGGVRLTRAFLTGKRVRKKELARLRDHVRGLLAGVAQTDAPVIGVGGTIRNLCEVDIASEVPPLPVLHGWFLPRDRLAAVLERLAASKLEARKKIEGLSPYRADVIVAGAAVVLEVVDALGAPGLAASTFGIREGLLFDALLGGARRDVGVCGVESLALRLCPSLARNRRIATLAEAIRGACPSLDGVDAALLRAACLFVDAGKTIDVGRAPRIASELLTTLSVPGLDRWRHAMLAEIALGRRKPDVARFGGLLRAVDREAIVLTEGLVSLAEALDRATGSALPVLHVQETAQQIEITVRGGGRATLVRSPRWDAIEARTGRAIQVTWM